MDTSLSPFDRLGITPTATPAEVKTAYHAKLREFPAHTHPEDFKAIRAAYETIQKGEANQQEADFLKVRPLEATLDDTAIQQLRDRAIAMLNISIEDLIRETF
jgi:curved DNA-binding protein CbpA